MGELDLFGYKISNNGLQGDVDHAWRLIADGSPGHYLACANPHSLVVASRDSRFQQALQGADLLIPDGSGIYLAGMVLNRPVRERVAGAEFFMALSAKAQKNGGLRYFFLGSSGEVLSLITERLEREFPAITVCGVCSPPFQEEFSAADNARMVAAINEARPDVLWVGMTAPKQEKWIHLNREQLRVPFMGAIGAVFDFYAGTKTRPSRFWQKLGMEWFPRFLKEPRRLWERNIKSAPLFLWWLVRERLRSQYYPALPGPPVTPTGKSEGRQVLFWNDARLRANKYYPAIPTHSGKGEGRQDIFWNHAGVRSDRLRAERLDHRP
jgi:N-acetylglucosaminyldiphosphoundecaprenol N-acetyl-beta-D-mannosaminyltransferase